MDIRLCLMESYYEYPGIHPQVIMKDLGISYQITVPQSIADCWWFLGCERVPNMLPKCLSKLSVPDYYGLVGHGLTVGDANQLTEWRAARREAPNVND